MKNASASELFRLTGGNTRSDETDVENDPAIRHFGDYANLAFRVTKPNRPLFVE